MQHLILKTKKEVFSRQSGLFSSKKGGEGYDFLDLAEYDYQSDAKRIDWKSYAKTGRLYTKIYQEEFLKNILIIPILSGSLHFGKRRLKSEILFETLGLIAFSALREGAKLKILDNFFDNIHQLQLFLLSLARQNLIGERDSLDEKLFYRFGEKHLTIVISDFLEFTNLSLFAARDDVVAIIIKERFDAACEAELVDNQTLKKLPYNLTKSSLAGYRKNMEKILLRQKEHFFRHKIDFIEVGEDDNIFQKLYIFFKER